MATVDDFRTIFAEPPIDAAPMMRWWWFGPHVTEAEVDRELTAMRDAGLEGAEIAYVYPLDDQPDRLLSDEFLRVLRHATETARDLGLRIDLTGGTGWSYGGPHIGPDHAARGLHWEVREIGAEPLRIGPPGYPGDQLLAAYVGDGSAQEPTTRYTWLPVKEGGIDVPPGVGPRHLLIATSRLSGQNVKRAAYGAEGPVMDHYSAAATRAHIAGFCDVLLDAVDPALIETVFCDSLEVYESTWTPRLPEEFRARRGYDLLPRLYELLVPRPTSAEVRADFVRTLTELYESEFIAVMRDWAHSRGVEFRIQSYGTPPGTVSSYRFADRFEGEGWGWRDLTQSLWATSAAHLWGRDVCSAETWTWIHSPSLRATPLDLQGEAHELMLIGMNHLIGHGWPYSPPEADGVGWLFYASGCLDDRNPWWPAMPAFATYLRRLSWLLRQGEPANDVALYVPAADVAQTVDTTIDLWRATRTYLGDGYTAAIRTGGWGLDLIDDDACDAPGATHRVIVLAKCSLLPRPTADWLARRIADGATVFLADCEVEVPGAIRTTEAELAHAVAAVLPPDVALEPNTGQVGVVHRRTDAGEVYFVANTSATVQEVRLTPRTEPTALEVWDARTGTVTRRVAGGSIALALEPYEAAVVVGVTGGDSFGPASERETFDLVEWQSAAGDAPAAPVALPHVWEETEIGEIAGTVSYTAKVDLPDPGARRVLLDFGPCLPDDHGSSEERGMRGRSFRANVSTPIREVAEIAVNGIACGVLWAPPYAIDVTGAARTGRNEVTIKVSNTAGHAVTKDQTLRDREAMVSEGYGVRFRMQELDLGSDGVLSGLLAEPAVVLES